MKSIISLGVGVQSTALYYMSCLDELPRLEMAIFADTGAEKKKTLDYLKYLLDWKEKNNGIPIHIASYINLYDDLHKDSTVLIPAFYQNAKGEKGMLQRRCTTNYKIRQITKKYREIIGIKGKHTPQTEIWIGITFDERERMKVPRNKWQIHVYPFCGYSIDYKGKTTKLSYPIKTRAMINEWYLKHNLPIPSKSSCVFCPFLSDYSFKEMKEKFPKDFEKACEIDDIIFERVNCRIHDTLKPLSSIQWRVKKGFFDDKGNCTDYCDI